MRRLLFLLLTYAVLLAGWWGISETATSIEKSKVFYSLHNPIWDDFYFLWVIFSHPVFIVGGVLHSRRYHPNLLCLIWLSVCILPITFQWVGFEITHGKPYLLEVGFFAVIFGFHFVLCRIFSETVRISKKHLASHGFPPE